MAAFGALAGSSRPKRPRKTAADCEVRIGAEKKRIPGLALLVSGNGQPIRTEGYGLSNVELQTPVKPETIFQSGSVGKQFTATAVMMLVEAGKVGLEDPLTKYFLQAPAWWKDVTVRELLSHTAGFTDYPNDFDMRKDYGEEDLIRIVSAIPPTARSLYVDRTPHQATTSVAPLRYGHCA
jgi:CubicO group peptidase (beta-lactamase class C family)